MRKALIVGIDDYPSCPLKGCVNDAKAIAELLKNNQDGSPNFDIKILDSIVNRKELMFHLQSLFCDGTFEAVLFYFSGHGTKERDGGIVTPDSDGLDFGISMNDILSFANKSKSQNKIIILDSCYSGTMGEASVINSTDSMIAPGVTIITSSNRDETSVEDPIKGHGVFTELLIQGLNGGAADVGGNITPASLYSFIDQSLGSWEQRPLFKTNISSFIPIRKVEPKVPINILRKVSKYFVNPNDEYKLDPSYEFTNNTEVKHNIIEPYAIENHVNIFKDLQQLESVGIVEPVGEEHMYFAAMNSKSCKLTPLGLHYWKLSKDSRF